MSGVAALHQSFPRLPGPTGESASTHPVADRRLWSSASASRSSTSPSFLPSTRRARKPFASLPLSPREWWHLLRKFVLREFAVLSLSNKPQVADDANDFQVADFVETMLQEQALVRSYPDAMLQFLRCCVVLSAGELRAAA